MPRCIGSAVHLEFLEINLTGTQNKACMHETRFFLILSSTFKLFERFV